MKREGSRKRAELALLAIGLAFGAGLTVTLGFTYDVLTQRTVTTTYTMTSFVVITVPGTVTTTALYAQIQASVVSCLWSGSDEYCEVTLTNSGNLMTATDGNCSLTYSGQTYAGHTGPTLNSSASPGAPQQLIPGKSVAVYCQASSSGIAAAGAQVTGSISLSDGGAAVFSGTAA